MRPVGKARRKEFGFIRAPLRRVMDYLDESNRLSSLYSTGVLRLQGSHNLAAILHEVRDVLKGQEGEVTPEERQARLGVEKDLEDLAIAEAASGFRLLSAHAILGAWGVLESAIDDWVVEWLTRRPQDLDLDEDVELKLPAAAYVSQSAQDRAEVLFTALRKRQGQSFGVGINRFERPLAIVGLSAPVPDFLSDGVFELHKVRNVYAHCGGLADERFLADCPWFDLTVGEVVPVSRESFHAYADLLQTYLVLLVHRGYARVGIRLDGARLQPYWDPSVTVVGESRARDAEYCATLPASWGAIPVIRQRHSQLLSEKEDEGIRRLRVEAPAQATH